MSEALDSAGTLLRRLRSGERSALARALSHAESTLPGARAELDRLWQLSAQPAVDQSAPVVAGVGTDSLRIAFTGAPGAGKSSLIEVVGLLLAKQNHKLAVLPVDPTSPVAGGSLLADQVRMNELSRHQNVFIRPSASKGMLGGAAPHTQESIELCELAGYSYVIVETVGVGQSEIDAATLCDVVVLVLTPDAGDELQALKRGITEVSTAIVINKADSNRRAEAEQLLQNYRAAASLMGQDPSRVWLTSAREGTGVSDLAGWFMEQWLAQSRNPSERDSRRRAQRLHQFERALASAILPELLKRDALRAHYESLRAQVASGEQSAAGALTDFCAALSLA
jgi:LAO/AO transport system kinase